MSLPIHPETRIGQLLEAYPEAEALLIQWVPAFSKLKNPVLRRTVAKVATLEQAARIAGLAPRELVQKLREALGQPSLDGGPGNGAEGIQLGELPAWITEAPVQAEIDADAMLERNEHPIGEVRRRAAELAPGQCLRLRSSFRPIPLMDTMARAGYAVYSVEREPGHHETYICRPPAGSPGA